MSFSFDYGLRTPSYWRPGEGDLKVAARRANASRRGPLFSTDTLSALTQDKWRVNRDVRNDT